MPANRSRTERWRELLESIAQRGGGLEITVARDGQDRGADLMWRVRLVRVQPDSLVVEAPAAAGKPYALASGTPLVCVMTVGQNRWMFRSAVMGETGALARIAMPDHVDRCARREFLRVPTAQLRLPTVECWPLLDPITVVPAEAANRERIISMQGDDPRPLAFTEDILPEVGPKFGAALMNMGGGGVGLVVNKNEASNASSIRLLWLRIDLTPEIAAPIAMTARVVHTHLDSEQNLYVGAAFDFDFNPAHRAFIVDQIGRYIRVALPTRAAA
ncbi:MAG: hypothetical protein SFY69_11155 [Planctomycetota bacterium]|nr:hypothetical protein [Planctomycetota bacterium]